ncbi:MAG: ABC-F family ATP-binding cassette domain-containing protein, partial [Candidatus Cloacimonetes bacterium]|nr:ABC-F family ATP-binding cassette domain-containing protein [Candidatus Cloacimonadota bacterium]
MIEISLQNVFKSFGADPVLKGINLELKETERLGLIGSNGSGKTTIFRLITGNEVGDSGVISLRKERTIGYLHQVPDAFNSLQAEAVLQLAFRDLFQIRQRMARIEAELEHAAASHLEELMRDYGELQNQFEQQGGYKIEMLINKICAG